MGKFAVIGLGNFGSNVARTLFELGHDVVAVDKNEQKVNAAQGHVAYSMVGQATDKRTLASLHVKDLDGVFVSMGGAISDSILVALHLLDLEAKRIVCKIISDDHGRILMKLGAHEVIFPERDMAVRVAHYVSSPSIMNYLDLSPEYSIQEVAPPESFIGKSLSETKIRQEFHVNVIGIKDLLLGQIELNPRPDFKIKDSDVLIVIGHRDDLARFGKTG